MKTLINELAVKIFEQCKAAGWWDDMNRCVYQTLQLVSTELAEATEGERKNLMDDHIPTRRMGEVELADALIRLLDLAGRYNWSFRDDMYTFHALLIPEPFLPPITIGRQHFACNMALCDLGSAIYKGHHRDQIEKVYSIAITSILHVGYSSGYDIFGALGEKLEYNKTREDHKRESRQKKHGKKF